MKKNWLKRLVAMALSISMVAAFSGCQGNETASNASTGGGSSSGEGGKIENFNETGYPICPDEKVTLRVMMSSNPQMPSDLNELDLIKEAEETMNVHVEWIMVPSNGWNDKKSLALATGDLPDIFDAALTTADLTKYGPEGTFIPMQDLLEKYGVNFKAHYDEFPDLEKYITAPDGNIYGLARINSGPWMTTTGVGAINQDWLDAVDMDMPTTIDEFYEVLKAFKTQDPNGNGMPDEIAMMGGGSWHQLAHDWLMNAFIYDDGETRWMVNDGKLDVPYNKEEWREGLRYLNELVSEGLFDPLTFTQDGASFKSIATSGDTNCLGVVCTAPSLAEAVDAAYSQCEKVHFANAYYRRDIGKRALDALKG